MAQLKMNWHSLMAQLLPGYMHFTSVTVQRLRNVAHLRIFYFFFRLAVFFSGLTSTTRRMRSSNGRYVSLQLDPHGKLKDYIVAELLGAHWFRPDECARGGMPGMVRWPR
jgi:hypothetical protein